MTARTALAEARTALAAAEGNLSRAQDNILKSRLIHLLRRSEAQNARLRAALERTEWLTGSR